jgi:hypothetical protein
MHSTMAKIVSLADPEQKVVAYDGRLAPSAGGPLMLSKPRPEFLAWHRGVAPYFPSCGHGFVKTQFMLGTSWSGGFQPLCWVT